jgi:hypothetical protein
METGARDDGRAMLVSGRAALLLLMYLHAGDRWGLGRWWRRHTPKLLH